ncbi:MAG: hypothetical protein B7Y83_13530 [Flavobacteriales bacterium 32-34-25]|nr:MAG: hypothetical protein B7Y83_13530 [Flavobacteriales bacterium 32-34-25]
MLIIYILIFILLNVAIYFVINRYNIVRLQILFIFILIVILKCLSNIFEKDVVIFSLLQLLKFSTSIPIFSLLIKVLRFKVKLKYEEKYNFLSFIWNEKTNFPLIFTLIILCYQIIMLFTGSFMTL